MINQRNALMAGTVLATALLAAPALAQDELTRWEPRVFEVQDFEVDGFAGTLEIIVENRSDVEVVAFGTAEKMDRLDLMERGDTLELNFEEDRFRWNDWTTWLGWWRENNFDLEDYPTVTVRLPESMPVEVDGMTGRFTMGDLNGPLEFSGAGAVDATIGNLARADFNLAGAADVHFGNVTGALEIDAAGATSFDGGDAERADISIQGAGEVTLGRIMGGLDVSSAGMGEVTVAYVDGPVDLSIAGAGEITIEDGTATSFDASIAGAGDITFRGLAYDPDISIAGAGDVFIQRYEGRLSHSGMGDVNIGSGS